MAGVHEQPIHKNREIIKEIGKDSSPRGQEHSSVRVFGESTSAFHPWDIWRQGLGYESWLPDD
jgi:hypothetical protein